MLTDDQIQMAKIVGSYDCEPSELMETIASDVAILGSRLCLTIMKHDAERFTGDESNTLRATVDAYKMIVRLLEIGWDAFMKEIGVDNE